MFTKKSSPIQDELPLKPANQTTPKSNAPAPTPRGIKTRITIKFDVGYGNSLYIRGKGANLSWDKGTLLKNLKADEWVWETEVVSPSIEFKVLINDRQYEIGPNRTIHGGGQMQYVPKF